MRKCIHLASRTTVTMATGNLEEDRPCFTSLLIQDIGIINIVSSNKLLSMRKNRVIAKKGIAVTTTYMVSVAIEQGIITILANQPRQHGVDNGNRMETLNLVTHDWKLVKILPR